MRWTLAILVLAACGVTFSLFFGRDNNSTTHVLARATTVNSHEVSGDNSLRATEFSEDSERKSNRSILANGTVEGSTQEIPLRFEVAGRLKSVGVQEGSSVHAGEVLAQLMQDSWVHAVSIAEASVALAESERTRLINGARVETRELAEAQFQAAKSRASQAHKRLERALALFERNAVSHQELDDLSGIVAVTQSELDAADARAREIRAPARLDEVGMADAKVSLEKAKRAQAEAELAKTELVAPCDGTILRVHNEPGELVGPEGPLPCLVMVEAHRKRIRAYVEELDAPAVARGQRAYAVADGMPKHRYWGSVVSCAPSMVPKKHFNGAPNERVDVRVREVLIELDSDEGLVIGLPVDVFIDRHDSPTDVAQTVKAREATVPSLGLPVAASTSDKSGRHP